MQTYSKEDIKDVAQFITDCKFTTWDIVISKKLGINFSKNPEVFYIQKTASLSQLLSKCCEQAFPSSIITFLPTEANLIKLNYNVKVTNKTNQNTVTVKQHDTPTVQYWNGTEWKAFGTSLTTDLCDKIAKSIWNLHTKRIAPICANWYLGYFIQIQKGTYDFFQEYTSLAAGIVSRYIDMAIGGELRHSFDTGILTTKFPLWLKMLCGMDLPHAWEKWHQIRSVDQDALTEAQELFQREIWRKGFGSIPWAKATEILYKYFGKEISVEDFLDLSFSLQHNTSLIFQKHFDDLHSLQLVLNAKANNPPDIKTLVSMADNRKVLDAYHTLV